jgi:hypothetical protein
MNNNNNSLGTQIPTFGNRIQVALDRAAADDLAAETTLRTLRQELANVQRQLEEFLLGTNHSKAEIAAARAEVAEATANRDRALVDWRITAEILQVAEANFRQAFLPIAPPLQAPQVVPQAMPVAAPQEPRQAFVQLNYLRCAEQGNKSIADSPSTPGTRKLNDGPCRLCAELGKSVTWTREHWNKEHPTFSKSKAWYHRREH